MSDPTIIAAAMVTVIAAIATAIVTVVNAVAAANDRRASREDRRVGSEARQTLTATTAATDRKTDTLLDRTTEIHLATNGTLAKAQAQLAEAHVAIQALRAKVHSLEVLLAALAAKASPTA